MPDTIPDSMRNDGQLLNGYLDLQHDGYNAYVMPVNDETKAWAGHVRDLHKERLAAAGYGGFSNEIDDEYHVVGTYFLVTKGDAIVVTSRVNDRTRSRRFPFEMGQRQNGAHYVLRDSTPSVDINTYSLIPEHVARAMPLLLATLGKYIDSLKARRAFCLVDVRSKRIEEIYRGTGFAYSAEFAEPIVFPTFFRGPNHEPVAWRIMEWTEEAIRQHRELHQTLGKRAK